jgi:membrane associated rhomboid family serine protease
MLPLRDDNPVRRPPILTWLIIGACLVAYFAWQPTPFSSTTDDIEFDVENAAIPCEVVQGRPITVDEFVVTYGPRQQADACGVDEGQSGPLVPDKNVWQAVITSLFLHGDLLHIGGNLLFLWIFGNNVEDALGKVGYLVFYLVGGVVATLSHVALNPDSTLVLVGASGSIAAVMGTYLVLFPNARVRTAVFLLLIMVIDLRAKWVLVAWFALQFFTDPNQGVAWAAHVGGFVFGVLVGLAVRSVRGPTAPVARHWAA